MNPLDEALMSKEAGFLSSLKSFGNTPLGGNIAAGLATAGAAGAAAGVAAGVKKLVSSATARRDYNAMMSLDPELEQMRADNPKFFNTAYTSLRKMNPTYGNDPIVASAMMRRMMESPGGAGMILAGSLKPPSPLSEAGLGLSVGTEFGPVRFERRF
jgi:lipid-binding SYLF domain-containing protein